MNNQFNENQPFSLHYMGQHPVGSFPRQQPIPPPFYQMVFPPGLIHSINGAVVQEEANWKEMKEIEEYMDEELKGSQERECLEELNQISKEFIQAEKSLNDTRWARWMEIPEMADEMDAWEDVTNQKENLHALIARSPQGAGTYVIPDYRVRWRRDGDDEVAEGGYSAETIPNTTVGFLDIFPKRKERCAPTTTQNDENQLVLDKNNRILITATVTNKGVRYSNARSIFGPIYVDNKYQKYLPNTGSEVKLIAGLKSIVNGFGKEYTHPLNCYRIL